MIFNYRFGILCVFSVLLSTIGNTAADDSRAELEPLWKPYPGPRDLGGCDEDLQNLKDSYSQAIEICKAAIAALNHIQDPKPEDLKEGQEWDRQARMAKAMFNLDTDPTAGIPGGPMRTRQGKILSE